MRYERNVSKNMKEAILRGYANIEGYIRCGVTGLYLPRSSIHIDHVIPLSKGGSNKFFNLIPIDKRINLAKSDNRFAPYLEKPLLNVIQRFMLKVVNEYMRLSKKELVIKDPLWKSDPEAIVYYLAPTDNWSENDLTYLVKEYVNNGKSSFSLVSKILNRSPLSLITKLASIGIYNKNYTPQ